MTEEPKQPLATATRTKSTSADTPAPRKSSSKSGGKHKSKSSANSATTKHRAELSAVLITFVVVVLAVFFGAQFFMKAGVFQEPGKVVFAEATELTQDFVNNNLPADLALQHDVTITNSEFTTRVYGQTSQEPCAEPQTTSSKFSYCATEHILTDILLPVTAWNSPQINISATDAKNSTLISVWNLDDQQKLLQLDGKYYLDDFASGGFFQYLDITGEKADVEKITEILQA